MFGGLKKWNAVRPALDLADQGHSIFGRKKPLSENTLKRIYAGLVKYIGHGKEPEFIAKHFSGRPEGKVHPTTEPARTITTSANQSVVFPEFLLKYHGNGQNLISVTEPSSTLTTKDRIAKLQVVWLDKQYSSKHNHQSIQVPSGSILTKDKYAQVSVFIMNQFSGGGQHRSPEQPLGSLTTVPKSNVIRTESLSGQSQFYLLNPQFQSKGNDLDRPCFTLIARMDKMPPYLVESQEGTGAILIYETDCPTLKKIKLFMARFGIVDIKMRMLKVNELLRIQGFGDAYILKGSQTQQKKFIGNAVEVNLVKAKVSARLQSLAQYQKTQVKTA